MKQFLGGQGQLIKISTPIVMGILNLSQDSFYEGSRYDEKGVLAEADKMIQEGAKILDLGAVSSRPGAKLLHPEEEWARLSTALKSIRKHFPNQYLSVDTVNHSTAERAMDLGVNMINDISGGSLDDNMFKTIAKYQAAYCLMHMPGTPEIMQNQTQYERGMIQEIQFFLSKQISKAIELGLNDIVIDPGFGFGKKLEQNYELAQKFDQLQVHKLPVLAGISRKSMLYKALNTDPNQALNASTALHMLLLTKGAQILRVHDVKEAVEAIKIFTFVQNPQACSS